MMLEYLQTLQMVNYVVWRNEFLLNISNVLLMYNVACLTFIRCGEDVLFVFLGRISQPRFRL
jgi:hypothetical protein